MNIGQWTDEEVSTLVRMWPTSSGAQIAARLRRSCGSVLGKAKQLQKKGLLGDKNVSRPDPQDFDKVQRDYCREHNITIADLCARFEGDNQLAAELYRLALAAKLTRSFPRKDDDGPVGLVGDTRPPRPGSRP